MSDEGGLRNLRTSVRDPRPWRGPTILTGYQAFGCAGPGGDARERRRLPSFRRFFCSPSEHPSCAALFSASIWIFYSVPPVVPSFRVPLVSSHLPLVSPPKGHTVCGRLGLSRRNREGVVANGNGLVRGMVLLRAAAAAATKAPRISIMAPLPLPGSLLASLCSRFSPSQNGKGARARGDVGGDDDARRLAGPSAPSPSPFILLWLYRVLASGDNAGVAPAGSRVARRRGGARLAAPRSAAFPSPLAGPSLATSPFCR